MSTPFALFLCGPRVRALADAMPPLIEELAGRGVAIEVQSPSALRADVACIILLDEPSAAEREALLAKASAAVVVAFEDGCEGGFEPVLRPHLSVPAGGELAASLISIVALLEGLGYIAPPARGALSDGEDAALLAGLRDLGYA